MNTKEKTKTALIILIILIDIGLAAANIIQDRKNQEAQWIGTIPMANQRIESVTGSG